MDSWSLGKGEWVFFKYMTSAGELGHVLVNSPTPVRKMSYLRRKEVKNIFLKINKTHHCLGCLKHPQVSWRHMTQADKRHPWGSLGPHNRACLKHPYSGARGRLPIRSASIWWGNRREQEAEWFMCCGIRQLWRNEGHEEWADVGGVLATQDQGNIWAWAATYGHTWAHDNWGTCWCP